jgi:hypothetical protein
MSCVLNILRSRFPPRATVLALMTIGVAACSADTPRSNSSPEATGSISQTETTQVQPHRNSRVRRPSPAPSTSPTTARPAAAPDITGSVVRKSTSSANRRSNGDMAITVAGGETMATIARRAETASTEPRGAAGDFAARWPDLPKTPNLDAREPATTSNSRDEEHEPREAEEEMPLIWPVLTEAERAGLPDPARESVLKPAFLAAALAMVLLFVGAIFKLDRRHARRNHWRVVPGRPHQDQQMRG